MLSCILEHSTKRINSDTERVQKLIAADVIQPHWALLKEQLSPYPIVDVLYSGKLISMVDVEEIYSNTRRQSAHLLLEKISRSSLDVSLSFATILVNNVNKLLKQVGQAIVEVIATASPGEIFELWQPVIAVITNIHLLINGCLVCVSDVTVPNEVLSCLSALSSIEDRPQISSCQLNGCNIVPSVTLGLVPFQQFHLQQIMFKIKLTACLSIIKCDVVGRVACINSRLLLIGCESLMLTYDIKTKEKCCISFAFKLYHLFASHGKPYGIVEDTTSQVTSLLKFDIQSSSYVHINNLPYQVKFSSIAYSDEYVCIIGGTDRDGRLISLIQIYNFQLKEWIIKPLDKSKWYPSCTSIVINTVLYILNNEDGSIQSVHLSPNSVCRRDSLPPVPFRSCCKLLSNKSQLLCVVEGSNTIYALNEASSLKQEAWQLAFMLPYKLHGVDGCALDNTSMVIMGTEDHKGYKRGSLYLLRQSC